MPYTLIYSTVDRVQFTLTGNTIGLNGNLTVGQQGVQGTIGGLITLNQNSVFGNFPNGTTGDFTQDRSAAILRMPDGAVVRRAQLTWSAYFDVATRALVKNPVSFVTPSGAYPLAPQISNYKVLNSTSLAYSNSSDVTALVSEAGTYSVGSIPITLVNNDVNIYGGWTLQVVFSLPSLPYRALALYYNQDLIGGAVTATQTLSGFSTPAQGVVRGRLIASAGEGDAEIVGDQLLLGPDVSALTPVSGPNNFSTNFFASQINGDDGRLDRSGTFGTKNNVNGSPGGNVSGARQGWDITNVDISGLLTNSLTQVVTRAVSTADFYLIPVLGLQIDANAADLTLAKTSTPTDAFIGENLTYTVTVANSSEVTASAVQFIDALSPYVVFTANSFQVNGIVLSGANPAAGVSLGELQPGDSVIISYMVTLTESPPGGILNNTAVTNYQFESLPGGPAISGFSQVTHSLPVYVPDFEINKEALAEQARVGDSLTYRIELGNTGNLSASSGELTDPLSSFVAFIPGTVTINGVVDSGANPANGIALPVIPAGETLTVEYRVQVNATPEPPQIVNQADASLRFTTPGGLTTTIKKDSNVVVVPVFVSGLQLTKAADRSFVQIGEILTYTIVAANFGSLTNQNVTVTDAVPEGATFVEGSVFINGISSLSANPALGIEVGDIPSQSNTVVQFQILVNAIPSSMQIINTAEAQYQSTSAIGPFPIATVFSNTVTIPVLINAVQSVKSADRAFVLAGETISYTLRFTNEGTTLMSNLRLLDLLPLGTEFVTDTFTINGTVYPDYRPDVTQNLPPLAAGAAITIQYQVFVTGVPTPAELRNQALLEFDFVTPDGLAKPAQALTETVVIGVGPNALTVRKSADHLDALVGEVVSYQIIVSNANAFTALRPVLTDLIPAGMILIVDSLSVDGVIVPDADPLAGILLPDIPPDSETVIAYRVLANAVPVTGRYENVAEVSFRITGQGAPASAISNQVSLPVIENPTSLTKSASVPIVVLGESYAYEVKFFNESSQNLTQITIVDLIPQGTVLMPDTVQVSTAAAITTVPELNIVIASISAGEEVVIQFQVTALGNPADLSGYVNTASASFMFNREDGSIIELTTQSNTVTVQLQDAPTADIMVVKSADTSTALIGQTITYSISVTNNGLTAVNDILLRNLINEGLLFLPGSITIDGKAQPRLESSVVSIGSLLPNEARVVTVQAVVDALPPSGDIVNRAIIEYDSVVRPSNAVVIPLEQSRLVVEKSVSSTVAYVGQQLHFLIQVRNEGSAVVRNAVFRDPISLGIRIERTSLLVNGVRFAIDSNSIDGLSLGDIAAGQIMNISFSAIVDSMPSNAVVLNQAFINGEQAAPDSSFIPIEIPSNFVAVSILPNDVTIRKSSGTSLAFIGAVIDYIVEITNNGSSDVSGFALREVLPPGVRYVPDSLCINGVTHGVRLSPFLLTAAVGTITPGQTVRVSYSVRVVAEPIQGEFPNQVVTGYNKPLPTGVSVSIAESSNTIIIPYVPLNVRMSKNANQQTVNTGEVITYFVSVQNTGLLTLLQVVFMDVLPDQVNFLTGSFQVNGIVRPDANFVQGVPLEPVLPGQKVQISYQARIESESAFVENTALLQFLAQSRDGRAARGELRASFVVQVEQEEE
ncbi:hypothetical protein PghCCS26_54250 [Paenibacillus glycanilyticus]|uniref:DUF11 domain-containing protein n=1 Tax=Paenibacillus glycanilyticus TaxID=126569 RepID=A0ABQ6NUR0_9BACL|nr:hypothetical protein PghCCS26_54250 [Paenibacillus glycanilyticus]